MSFKINIPGNRRAAARLLADAHEELAEAIKHRERVGETRASISRRLGKNRSWLSRLLNGRSNMTIQTLAEVAWALDHHVTLAMTPNENISDNFSETGEGAAGFHKIDSDKLTIKSTKSLPVEARIKNNHDTWTASA